VFFEGNAHRVLLLGLLGLAAAGGGCGAEPSVRCNTSAAVLCASQAACVAVWPPEAELSRFCRPDIPITLVTCASYSYARYGSFDTHDTYYYNAQTGRLTGAVSGGTFGTSSCLGGPPWFSAPPASDNTPPPGCRQIPVTCPSP